MLHYRPPRKRRSTKILFPQIAVVAHIVVVADPEVVAAIVADSYDVPDNRNRNPVHPVETEASRR